VLCDDDYDGVEDNEYDDDGYEVLQFIMMIRMMTMMLMSMMMSYN
jgi:hypothetical protein